MILHPPRISLSGSVFSPQYFRVTKTKRFFCRNDLEMQERVEGEWLQYYADDDDPCSYAMAEFDTYVGAKTFLIARRVKNDRYYRESNEKVEQQKVLAAAHPECVHKENS